MARRQFEVIDVVEVLQHWHAGRPKSVVASSLGIDPKTVRKYVAKATEAGLAPGGPALSRTEWAELVRGWCPELVDPKARSLTFPVIDAHRERIADMLETNTVATVHQRMRDEHGLAVGISSFRRFVASEFPDSSLRERVTVLRPEVPAGEETLCGKPHSNSSPGAVSMGTLTCGARRKRGPAGGAPPGPPTGRSRRSPRRGSSRTRLWPTGATAGR